MGISSGLAQAGSITINGNQSVLGGSTWTYSIIGASCSQANWIINGGVLISSDNVSVTVQWSVFSGSGTVQVSSYGCSPTPESRTGLLNVTRSMPPIFISGRIVNQFNAGISGVPIGGTTTDSNGYYSITVNPGYSGTLTPYLIAYAFSPQNRTYSNITSNQANQDYARFPPFFFIHEPHRPADTPITSGSCLTGWEIINLPSYGNGYVWQFTNWDDSVSEQSGNSSYYRQTQCGGRNTYKKVCVRAVGSTEWICFNY
jgi:hypothetical protein